MVVATYVLAPLPNYISSKCSDNNEFYSDNDSNKKDFGQFLTAILLVTGVCE
ncbi:9413_t:CDS:2 [Funneliformis mosseae]|uniref:9413_t:CDS:1 n=1 Tax=Funneliformis mosseae TaxID=27381 RepID=A0A9N9C804_FUNMO|nr:9413_t:CDS:2 [Funneliformis mosseae]